MSLNSSSSLVSDSLTEITSYDIPLQCQSNNHGALFGDLPSMETTSFVTGSIHQYEAQGRPSHNYGGYGVNPTFDSALEDESSTLSHGFFLGKESLQNLAVPELDGKSSHGILEENDTEDEGISEIYNNDPNTWIRRSDRSFKYSSSPEPTPRHALSRRIGNIGIIGQNIGLGHRLGVLTEDASLIPKKVKLNAYQFTITEDSPTQNDITWTKPDNASNFTSLIYKIEIMPLCIINSDSSSNTSTTRAVTSTGPSCDNLEGDDIGKSWTQLADVRWPTFRIYHTDDKLFVGRVHVSRQRDDVTIRLRVRCHGELVLPDRTRHWTMGSYSQIANVIFAGYDYNPAPPAVEAQLTHL